MPVADVFESVLRHLRKRGPVLVPTSVGDLRVVGDPAISQIYVYDRDIMFSFSFYSWFADIRGRARRTVPGGEIETPVLTLRPPATPTALVALLMRTSTSYIERSGYGC